MNSRLVLAGLCAAFTACTSIPHKDLDEVQITADDYAAAERLISHHIGDKLRNDRITVHWLDGGEALRYERDGADGAEHVRVATASGE